MRLTPEPGGSRIRIEHTPPINYSHYVTIQASRDGGETWREVPSLAYVPIPDDGPVCVYDYTAPLNSTSWYRAIPFRKEGDLLVAAPNFSEWLPVTLPGEGWWLK